MKNDDNNNTHDNLCCNEYVIDCLSLILSNIIYNPDKLPPDSSINGVFMELRAALLDLMNIESDYVPYTLRDDGIAFGDLQNKFNQVLYDIIKMSGVTNHEMLILHDIINNKPRLKIYGRIK